jgi:hypothetical protein
MANHQREPPRWLVSCPRVLAECYYRAAVAWDSEPDEVVRAELRVLAREAELLSVTSPLRRSAVLRRQEVAAEVGENPAHQYNPYKGHV